MARGEKAVLAVSGESGADTDSSGYGVGKAQAVNLGRGRVYNPTFLKGLEGL